MYISIIQTDLVWENKKANLANLDSKIKLLAGKTDLIVLPEMFTTGFSMNPSYLAETMEGETMQWLSAQAHSAKAAIMGSFIAEENQKYYNRLVFMRPDGTFHFYDKRHLFSMANEHLHYTAGTQKMIVEWRDMKINMMICYDLRFPAWSYNTESYDILIYVANWPQRRATHWKALLAARAIENQSFVIGVNRVGTDANDLYYSGDSSILSPIGDILYQKADIEDIFTVEIQRTTIQDIRERMPFLKDKDEVFVR
jgi:predicted amidohydrolase